MRRFLARVAIEYPFAQERFADLGGFWSALASAAEAEHSAKLEINRFTFAVFSLNAENKEECRTVLLEAWEKTFGDRSAVSDIFITPLEDVENSDHDKLMNSIYKNYYGADDYMRLVTEMADTVPLLREKNALDVARKQSYLFAVDGGCGTTQLINSFGDFLHRIKIYPDEQYADRRYYIEMKMAKETGSGFTDADDVIDFLRENKEKNSYNIVGLDISYYLEGSKADELRAFIKRLEDHQRDYIFMFRIPFLEKKALDEIKNTLEDLMLLRVVQIPPPDDAVLMETIWNILSDKGFSTDPGLYELIQKKIHREKMDGRSYGFKTAEKIASEILLRKAADIKEHEALGEEADKTTVFPADLPGFVDEENTKLTGFEALAELIGMEEISERLREIVAQVKLAMKNERLERPCIHMRFTGAPGTGKTTVARLVGQILREEGVLRKGGFFEYEARELVAEYEGQTAVKTASVCRDAYGSVLFLDEAYALNEGSNGKNIDFGREALATLVSEMENHRDDMLVVMAGYEDEMEALMKVNQGLRSRMPYKLHFPNYTKEQLFGIYMQMVKKHFDFEPELETRAHDFFLSLSDAYIGSREFANARFARNLYERTWSKGALRCSLSGKTNMILTAEDLIAASAEKEFSEKIETKKRVGFNS